MTRGPYITQHYRATRLDADGNPTGDSTTGTVVVRATPTLRAACRGMWGNERTRCRYWSPQPGWHGCTLEPGHQGGCVCGCGRKRS